MRSRIRGKDRKSSHPKKSFLPIDRKRDLVWDSTLPRNNCSAEFSSALAKSNNRWGIFMASIHSSDERHKKKPMPASDF
ncbi:hypothetical protein TNIN_342721 [Trichonephila inaurata madagascariensis]|uniref:Uncharacterized protein n=1 Tax=Trichonephila inaurata madagascariensis TaxID=2747483 RepID=A0A8X6XF75_9ARAC|nr:hypothetical protein TNIN_342721 [Trichonephila inaurata madagascariensis]